MGTSKSQTIVLVVYLIFIAWFAVFIKTKLTEIYTTAKSTRSISEINYYRITSLENENQHVNVLDFVSSIVSIDIHCIHDNDKVSRIATGTIISEDSNNVYILTADHVTRLILSRTSDIAWKADHRITVGFSSLIRDKKDFYLWMDFDFDIIERNDQLDLAILRCPKPSLKILPIRLSRQNHIGDKVFVISMRYPIDNDVQFGTIINTEMSRILKQPDQKLPWNPYKIWETSVNTSGAASGAPTIDYRTGNLVGIVVGHWGRNQSKINKHSYIVPYQVISEWLESIKFTNQN